MDDAGEKIGGNSETSWRGCAGRWLAGSSRYSFARTMDTVVPGKGVKPVEKDGVITSSGDTILGSMIIGRGRHARTGPCAQGNNIPFGEIELLFTIAEEHRPDGAKHFDTSVLKSKRAFFLDSENVQSICTGAPSAYRMNYRIFGQEAHAGMCPEKGLSAILVAAKAIQQCRWAN